MCRDTSTVNDSSTRFRGETNTGRPTGKRWRLRFIECGCGVPLRRRGAQFTSGKSASNAQSGRRAANPMKPAGERGEKAKEKGLPFTEALCHCIGGAAGRIRTHDPLVRSQVLYPTELQPHARPELYRNLHFAQAFFEGTFQTRMRSRAPGTSRHVPSYQR